MDSAIVTALDAARPLVFCCAEIVLMGGGSPVTLRFLDGGGPDTSLTIGGHAFKGSDSYWGSISLPASIQDAVAGEAGQLEFEWHPPSDAVALELQGALSEDSTVRFLGPGAIDRATGLSIADPDQAYFGFVADAPLTLDRGKAIVAVQCIDGFGRLLDRGDGYELNGAAHESIWTGEKGLEFVTDVERPIYWGSATPASATGSVVTRSGIAGLLQRARNTVNR